MEANVNTLTDLSDFFVMLNVPYNPAWFISGNILKIRPFIDGGPHNAESRIVWKTQYFTHLEFTFTVAELLSMFDLSCVLCCFIMRLRELTCILLLPQSATMMFPLTSTATPVGALN